MKPALLIIDMQNDFFKKVRLVEHKENLIKKINELAGFARQHSVPVIWIRQVLKADLSDAPLGIKKQGKRIVIEDTKGSQFLDGLDMQSTDIEVIKKRYSGFFQTNLSTVLQNHGVDTLIIAGINTHACVRMTAIDGYQNDYEVIIAEDCVDSYDQRHHDITMKYFQPTIAQVVSNEGIGAILASQSM